MTNETTIITPKETLHTLLRMGDKDEKLLHSISNSEWQDILLHMKSTSTPSSVKRLKRSTSSCGTVMRMIWSLTDNELKYESLDAGYVNFINHVLTVIRSGDEDYCYHTYQICELVRFEPEIEVELRNGIFYVWLDKEKKRVWDKK